MIPENQTEGAVPGRSKIILSLAFFMLTPAFPLDAQSGNLPSGQIEKATHVAAEPRWLPIRIPTALYERWRKYGIWDYKQQGVQYRQFTQFNFGATGRAAGIDQKSLLALAEASKPTPYDVKKLDDPKLLANFKRNSKEFDKLLAMSQKDSHLIRIADDYTWLDSDTKWPRANIGLSLGRWDEYRQFFARLSLAEGILRTPDFPGATFFIVRARGLCTGGSSAGYVYSTKALSPTSESPGKALDAEARQDPKKYYAYVFKPLKPDWYAFYEIDW